MQLAPDSPVGQPSFDLSEDQVVTVVDLVCRGASEARANITGGMLEVPITVIVRKAIRHVKKMLNLSNLQVRGEHELEDMATSDPSILGRIDITLQFLHQFGDEDAYVAIECKRVGAGHHQLNSRYVSEGVSRFVTGQYAAGHARAFMLGFVLALPVEDVVKSIDGIIRKTYGETAKLEATEQHSAALAILVGQLLQAGNHIIRLQHMFVDMCVAA